MEAGGHIRSAPNPGAEHGSPPDAAYVLDAMRAASDHEFVVAERHDAKTRHIMTVTGAYFAIVQTIVFTSGWAGRVHGGERKAILIVGIVASAALLVAFLASAWQAQSIKSKEMSLDDLNSQLNDLYATNTIETPGKIASHYHRMAMTRREANSKRHKKYNWTAAMCALSGVVLTGELILAMAARI